MENNLILPTVSLIISIICFGFVVYSSIKTNRLSKKYKEMREQREEK